MKNILLHKERLDIILAEKNFFDSRAKAKAMIMLGKILVDGVKIEKAGTLINRDAKIEIIGAEMPYVSRGGFKLQKALEVFKIDLQEKICADIGASTGGFTDCMLQHGAKKIYAVDVGYGQLAWKLRQDKRVVNLERTNIRKITSEKIPEPINFVSIDVSFISLEKVLPVAKNLLAEGGEIVCLIKPQFEAGRENVGKKGVVRDKKIHTAVIEKILLYAQEIGLQISGIDFSPVTGAEGNIEYLAHLSKNFVSAEINLQEKIFETVNLAHEELKS